jgi:NAD(P)-dependent dehydrogenase (short-subunit alcohol dehydrogenase family)/acyl carrier protein
VLVLPADVSNEEQMSWVIQQAITTFGTLHGVLHAAGVPGIGLIQLKTPEMAASVLAPKVMGTLVLERVLQDLTLDFLVLFSSITSTTGGGPGQVDYCAANAFLDTYARQHCAQHGITIAINWGEWKWNAWEAGLAGYDTEAQTFFRENRQRFGIAFEEGAEALTRVLSCRLPQVVVSTQDFRAMVELSRSFTATAMLQKTRQSHQKRAVHPRPNLASSYIAPKNEAERKIAAIWDELLGISQVGVYDNFFELGGNSLIGIDLIARLRKEFAIEAIPTYVLYEAPTVSAMAQYLDQSRTTVAVEVRHERGEKRRESLKHRMREARGTR